MKSQNAAIYHHLLTSTITPLEALHKYGCLRLSARIKNLRDEGYNIETKMKKEGKKWFAEYVLVNKKKR